MSMHADLRRYLATCEARVFRYGRHDCALFAAGWVRLRTGRDLTLGIRYASLREGSARLLAEGYADHVAVAAAQLAEIAPLQARPGDIAVLRGALGIVTGERLALPGRRGLAYAPLTMAGRAFALRGAA